MCLRQDLRLGALSFFPPQSTDSETWALLQFSVIFFFIGAQTDVNTSRLSVKKIKCKCWGNKNVSQPTGTRPEALTTSVITHLNATQLQSDCLFFRRRILHCARVTLSSSVICPTSEDCKNLFGKTETCRAEPNALSSRATSFGLFEIKGERG